MKWEYLRLDSREFGRGESAVDVFNKYGAECWELITAEPLKEYRGGGNMAIVGWTYTFKRPKQQKT